MTLIHQTIPQHSNAVGIDAPLRLAHHNFHHPLFVNCWDDGSGRDVCPNAVCIRSTFNLSAHTIWRCEGCSFPYLLLHRDSIVWYDTFIDLFLSTSLPAFHSMSIIQMLWKGRDVSYDAPVVKAHQFPQHFEFNAVAQERKRCKL